MDLSIAKPVRLNLIDREIAVEIAEHMADDPEPFAFELVWSRTEIARLNALLAARTEDASHD